MKKILALLMSVSMMASLFVSTAVTSYAADEATVKVTPVGKVTVQEGPPVARKDVDYIAFDVSIITDKTMDFQVADGWYNGTGLAGITLKFAFNSKYFDKSSAKIDINELPSASVQTNTADGDFVTTVMGVGSSALYTGSLDPLYRIRIKPVDEALFDKSAAELAKLACINDVFAGNKVTFEGYSDWTDDTGNVKSMPCTIQYDYPDTDVAPEVVKVETITADDLSLTVGDTGTIAYTVAPDNAADKKVTFKVAEDGADIIDVNATTGAYTAKKAGSTTITITSNDGNATKTINVAVADKEPEPEPDKVEFVKAVKSDKAATGYWVFKVNKGITETLKVTYANADDKLELDAPTAIGGESDVTFALYLTVTGDRIGKDYTAAVAHGADSATGTAITLD